MGVVAKLKGQSKDTLGAGVHLVIISDIKLARNNGGQILVKDETGEACLEVDFRAGDGKTISRRFWLTEASQWVFNNLCKAVKFVQDANNPVSTDVMKGRRLWITVGTKYRFEDGKIEVDSYGQPVVSNQVTSLFFAVYDAMLIPSVDGDPRLNNGIPSGKFLLNKPEELPVDFREQLNAIINPVTEKAPWD